MKRLLVLVALLWANYALAAERAFVNPDPDGNLILRVNDGGTVRDPLTIAGATTNVTIGTAVATAHTIQAAGATTIDSGTQQAGSYGSGATGLILQNTVDSSSLYGGIVWKPNGNGLTSNEAFGIYGVTSGGSNFLELTHDLAKRFHFRNDSQLQVGNNSSGANGAVNIAAPTGGRPQMNFSIGSNTRFTFGMANGANDLVTGSSNEDAVIRMNSANLHITADNGASSAMIIAANTGNFTMGQGITNEFSMTMRGLGFSAIHQTNTGSYFIGQNSNSRTIRMYSGSSSSTGVELTVGNNVWTSYSDERLKTEVSKVESALDEISDWRTVRYILKADPSQSVRYGVYAQDIQADYPEMVYQDSEGYLKTSYTYLVVPLIKAAQELKTENDELKSKYAALAARVEALEAAQ